MSNRPLFCDECGSADRRYDCGMCNKCADSFVREYDIPIEFAGSARVARTTAEKATIPMLDGLTLREKVRRLVLAYGGYVQAATDWERADADKLLAASPLAAFFPRRKCEPKQNELPPAEAKPVDMFPNPYPMSRGPFFQKPMEKGEDQKARQVNKDDW